MLFASIRRSSILGFRDHLAHPREPQARPLRPPVTGRTRLSLATERELDLVFHNELVIQNIRSLYLQDACLRLFSENRTDSTRHWRLLNAHCNAGLANLAEDAGFPISRRPIPISQRASLILERGFPTLGNGFGFQNVEGVLHHQDSNMSCVCRTVATED
jgi:hypothetical protein